MSDAASPLLEFVGWSRTVATPLRSTVAGGSWAEPALAFSNVFM
jgi:hypothetical protein